MPTSFFTFTLPVLLIVLGLAVAYFLRPAPAEPAKSSPPAPPRHPYDWAHREPMVWSGPSSRFTRRFPHA